MIHITIEESGSPAKVIDTENAIVLHTSLDNGWKIHGSGRFPKLDLGMLTSLLGLLRK